jgi:hypothetical protein
MKKDVQVISIKRGMSCWENGEDDEQIAIKLKHICHEYLYKLENDGYVLLSDVFRSFGLPVTSWCITAGWTKKIKSHPD